MEPNPRLDEDERFPCSQCGTPTHGNDLLRGDPGRVQICGPCLHAETIQELDKTNDYFNDHDIRCEGAPPDPEGMEDSEFEW